jgi:hypothetical protein
MLNCEQILLVTKHIVKERLIEHSLNNSLLITYALERVNSFH